jgi:hypothetical protein
MLQLASTGKSHIGDDRFSKETVAEIPRIYEEILPLRPSATEWLTPNLYSGLARSLGKTIPPK